jgi:hypothetical protein
MKWYYRDASFWRYPETSRPKKYHLANEHMSAACGTQAALDPDTEYEDPPEYHKCKRCKRLEEKLK